MASESEIELLEVFQGAITAAMDRVTTSMLDIMDGLPRTADGQIRDPYWRGIMDGVLTITANLPKGFEQVFRKMRDGV